MDEQFPISGCSYQISTRTNKYTKGKKEDWEELEQKQKSDQKRWRFDWWCWNWISMRNGVQDVSDDNMISIAIERSVKEFMEVL